MEPTNPRRKRIHSEAGRIAWEERMQELEAAYESAANDPVFMAEIRALAAEFDCTVGDGLGPEK